MDSSVVVQLIETGGILLISIVGFITYIMLSKRKNSANDEVSLLKDCLYYKLLVDKYKEHVSDFEDKNYLNTYRAELRDDLGYSPSRLSHRSNITSRLIELNEYTTELDKYIKLTKK